MATSSHCVMKHSNASTVMWRYFVFNSLAVVGVIAFAYVAHEQFYQAVDVGQLSGSAQLDAGHITFEAGTFVDTSKAGGSKDVEAAQEFRRRFGRGWTGVQIGSMAAAAFRAAQAGALQRVDASQPAPQQQAPPRPTDRKQVEVSDPVASGPYAPTAATPVVTKAIMDPQGSPPLGPRGSPRDPNSSPSLAPSLPPPVESPSNEAEAEEPPEKKQRTEEAEAEEPPEKKQRTEEAAADGNAD